MESRAAASETAAVEAAPALSTLSSFAGGRGGGGGRLVEGVSGFCHVGVVASSASGISDLGFYRL